MKWKFESWVFDFVSLEKPCNVSINLIPEAISVLAAAAQIAILEMRKNSKNSKSDTQNHI